MSWDESRTEEIIENKLSNIGWEKLDSTDGNTGYAKKDYLMVERQITYYMLMTAPSGL